VVVSRRVADQVTVGSIAAETGAVIEDSARTSHWSNEVAVQNVHGDVMTAKRLSGGTVPSNPRCHPESERRSRRGVGLDLDRGLEKRVLTSARELGP